MKKYEKPSITVESIIAYEQLANYGENLELSAPTLWGEEE